MSSQQDLDRIHGAIEHRLHQMQALPSMPRQNASPTATNSTNLERVLPDIKWNAIALQDVIQFLRDVTQSNFHVYWNALEAAGIDRNTQVTIYLKKVTLAKLLEMLMNELSDSSRVEYTVNDNVISITTEQSPDTAPSLVESQTHAHVAVRSIEQRKPMTWQEAQKVAEASPPSKNSRNGRQRISG